MTNISLLFSKRDSCFSFFSVCQDNAGMAINCQNDLNLSLSKYGWSFMFQALSAVNIRKKHQSKILTSTS